MGAFVTDNVQASEVAAFYPPNQSPASIVHLDARRKSLAS